jgi:CRP-like cAMP-binding protein
MPTQNALLYSLPDRTLSLLKPRLRHQQLADGHVLFSANDKVANVYFPVSGAISLVTELASGQAIETAIIGHDSVIAGGAALDDRDSVYKAHRSGAGQRLCPRC